MHFLQHLQLRYFLYLENILQLKTLPFKFILFLWIHQRTATLVHCFALIFIFFQEEAL